MTRGYFRFPAVFKNQVVFTSEDDLWEAPLEGGAARRLTAGRGSALYPCFSPDGRQLAFSSAEEGHNEVYVMPSEGGDLRRLTYLGSMSTPCGWDATNNSGSSGIPGSSSWTCQSTSAAEDQTRAVEQP